MSKRMVALRRMMVLLGTGGAFVFGLLTAPDLGCIRNDDLVNFYQGAGDATIDAFADTALNTVGSDFDAVVVVPAQGFFTAMWDNFVAQQFPLDVEPVTANVLRQ